MISIRIAGGWLYAMRRVLATVCIGVLAVFLGYKVIFGANGMKIWQAKRAEYDKLRVQIDEEGDKHEQLRHHVEALQRGDPSAIEKEAREQLGYVRRGETVLYEQQARPAPNPVPAVIEKEAQR